MKKGDVRGLSTIVATLLIILLVLVSIAIVWAVIKSVINNNAEQISFGKFTIDLEIVDVYPSNGITDTGIKVKRNPGEGDLEGIVFSIFDGNETHIFEKHNVSLKELEVKTFFVDYHGEIVSVSINPIFLGDSGKTQTGGVSDTFHPDNHGGGYISGNCTINCTNKECGDNGCGGSCGGCSGSTPDCVQGICGVNGEGEVGNCSCASDICIGTTCDDGLGGSCPGELTPEEDCGSLMCGESPSGCGSCGTCDLGYGCNEGICSPVCLPSECGLRECGGIPGRSECGQTFCGLCNATAGEECNITSGICFICESDCEGKECGDNGCGGSCGNCKISPFNSSYNCNATTQLCDMCTPNCDISGRECGPVPNRCGESCGNCTELYGYPEDSCDIASGICITPEAALNIGNIISVWPTPIGHNFIIGNNLPSYGEDGEIANLTNANYVKITSLYERCYPILKIDFPESEGQYTVIQVSYFPTDIEVGDSYEIWETIGGCNR